MKQAGNSYAEEIALIQATVADAFEVPVEWLKGNRRSREAARPRQVTMLLAHELLSSLSMTQIGILLDRDRNSVHHGIANIRNLMDRDGALAQRVAELRTLVRGRLPPTASRNEHYSALIASQVGREIGKAIGEVLAREVAKALQPSILKHLVEGGTS